MTLPKPTVKCGHYVRGIQLCKTIIHREVFVLFVHWPELLSLALTDNPLLSWSAACHQLKDPPLIGRCQGRHLLQRYWLRQMLP